MTKKATTKFFKHSQAAVLKDLGKKTLLEDLRKMLDIRNFETRAESAYQQGKIGGFFHAYIGQEAIQTAAVRALGQENWYITTYRCHALALLLGASFNEVMAELYGKETGNALGRGGSMHLFTDRLLGGYGIVGGHIPIATGAALTLSYKKNKDEVAICFMGDGAVAQGAFHESLNLAALWNLPCIYVIENNQWGMGTAVNRALSVDKLAETKGPSFGMEAYTFDGMDYFNCYAGFKMLAEKVKKEQRPVLVECMTERFRGHSISDPGLYRSKDELKKSMEREPISLMRSVLEDKGHIDEKAFKAIDTESRGLMVDAMKYAEESPWPNPVVLEEGVLV